MSLRRTNAAAAPAPARGLLGMPSVLLVASPYLSSKPISPRHLCSPSVYFYETRGTPVGCAKRIARASTPDWTPSPKSARRQALLRAYDDVKQMLLHRRASHLARRFVRHTQRHGRPSARRAEVTRRTGALAVKVGMVGAWDDSGRRHAQAALHVDD